MLSLPTAVHVGLGWGLMCALEGPVVAVLVVTAVW
jgi:hypothetical protein